MFEKWQCRLGVHKSSRRWEAAPGARDVIRCMHCEKGHLGMGTTRACGCYIPGRWEDPGTYALCAKCEELLASEEALSDLYPDEQQRLEEESRSDADPGL